MKKKETKKVVTKKVAKPKAEKVTLVEFTMSAVIPTVHYGNIQPSITVKCDSIDTARATVAPIIEDMYNKYAEQVPRFLKPEIKERVKTVAPEVITEKTKVDPTPVKPVEKAPEPAPAPVVQSHPVNATDVPFPSSSEAFLKAENAIKSASSAEALDLIQQKIESSTKIAQEEKPKLVDMIKQKYSLLEF